MANKSKRFRMRANKSRKNKRGGKKNHSLLTTQIAGSKMAYNTLLSQYGGQQIGGAPAPSPSPSSGYPYNLGNLDTTSLANALQQFGDAVQSFVYTGTSTKDAANAATAAVEAQQVAANNLQDAINALRNAYFGGSWVDDTGITQTTTGVTGDGLYKVIKNDLFKATPAPNPAPRPAPAPAP